MLDNDNRITYSEVPLVFPVNSIFQTEGASQGLTARPEDYYWFKATSNQGWSVVSVIAAADYNKEKNQWVIRMLLLLVLFLAINLLLALLVWNIVYRPLDRFDKEIKWIENGNFHTEAALTHIPEIDVLLGQFQKMKGQILELFKEVEIKEKRRADLEIEKLLYQINPHFLMNTLNTAHWMALMNDQTEIDQIIQTLNKLLSYNLGKTGRSTTIADELEALQQYVVLQQIRYEFEYATQISVDEEVLKMSIPRFILQPIVENAIYHGLSERGLITVKVELHDWIEISITDNGTGMTREKIEELLTKVQVDQVKVGMGIGMNYVKRMLESYYSGQAKIAIESLPGKGTTIRLCLPVQPVQAEGQ
jgi:two-component system sensor histidine kinase YesM